MSATWLITGCSTGIGREIAIAALEAGNRVAVTARKPGDVADIVERFGDRAKAIALDVSRPESVRDALEVTREWAGNVEVLVNNAGYGYISSIEEGSEAKVKDLFEVNFFGALRLIQAVLPAMRAARSGRIINISSLAGRISNPATGFYSSSKFAMEAMSEALAREVESLGIRVTALAPGMFRSDFSGRSLTTGDASIEDYRDGVHARMELVKSVDGRQAGDPAKLAEMVVKLAEMAAPPLQLIAGPDALAAITARMAEKQASMEQFSEWSSSTNFD
ncbi:SDR family NAD(P)-dependent oxidoreductase [Altererythrobacter aerius]|uniref:SDR family NAD(P)-dependent oxidoreductase n=1 Tax=Tsuneonella aeria TaxID=1837929 RepID=A0A6I4TB69_9SPHN|nr:oxidoreductase [Tsuneonella aeria]MXO74749.1 SDR family NAD(P)-dependent oxidoreductase [Tsuneonella aeria]